MGKTLALILLLSVGCDVMAQKTFTNPLYSGQDPWIVQHDGFYYYCGSEHDSQIVVWKSKTLTDRGEKKVVFTGPKGKLNSSQVWAPELHRIGGKWFVYYAASNGRNANHRMGVLEATTHDPQGEYIDRGMLYTGDDPTKPSTNRWAIDGTVAQINGKLYFFWSGWVAKEDVQYLYAAEMRDPVTIGSARVKICGNHDFPWEARPGTDNGLNEAPQILQHDGQIFLIYSCGGAWSREYKLGMLKLREKGDPLNPKDWTKFDKPVFQSTETVFGPGHCCFVKSRDGKQDWIVYHAKAHAEDGWQRNVFIQQFNWSTAGDPEFGKPVSFPTLQAPAGE